MAGQVLKLHHHTLRSVFFVLQSLSTTYHLFEGGVPHQHAITELGQLMTVCHSSISESTWSTKQKSLK